MHLRDLALVDVSATDPWRRNSACFPQRDISGDLPWWLARKYVCQRTIHIAPRPISTITAAMAVPVMNAAEAPIGEMILGSTTRKSVKVNEDKST